MHQLAKRGHQEIRIIERNLRGGQVSLYWKVEPSLAAGRPGQLAYHLDTLVIKQRLDRLSRPVPRLIRIGTLREIARELNHGGDTNAIKRTFEQNAATFIRAKVRYRTKDGSEEALEGYFNRYNVFFRGQKLPGGKTAETVYISLNDPYYGLINRKGWRPLDFGYLKQLPPTAQRFYELLSPKIYAVLKNGHEQAWTRYSEYCRYAVQKRQGTRRRMQIQMAPIHRPHLESGYISEVRYRQTASEDGMEDWFIYYAPGPKARAEFKRFNPDDSRARRTATHRDGVKARYVPSTPAEGLRAPNSGPSEPSFPAELARRFYEKRRGRPVAHVSPKQIECAEGILKALHDDHEAARIAVDLAARAGRDNPRGYPDHIGGILEGPFLDQASEIRDRQTKAQKAAEVREMDEKHRRRYEFWCRHRAKQRIGELTHLAQRELVNERLSGFLQAYRFFIKQREWSEEQARKWAVPKILEKYGREGAPTYAEWCQQHDTLPTSSFGSEPDPTVTPTC